MPSPDHSKPLVPPEHWQLVEQLSRDEQRSRSLAADAERVWTDSAQLREVEDNLSRRFELAAGYAGSPTHFLGRHVEPLRDHEDAVSRYEPMTVFLERTGHERRDWRGHEGYCQRYAAPEFCLRWVRDYWAPTVTLVRSLDLAEEDIRDLSPISDIEEVTRGLYLQLFTAPSVEESLVRAVGEQVNGDRAQLGNRGRELYRLFETLADLFRPMSKAEFVASWLEGANDHEPLEELLVTWTQVTKTLLVDGADWIGRAKRNRPAAVHAAPAGSGHSSLFRLRDVVEVLQTVSGRAFDLSKFEKRLREVARRSDFVPEWAEKR